MKVVLEEHVPSDASLRWRLHDAYYAARGITAWSGGELPHFATSNYPFARQIARLLVAHVESLDAAGALAADEEVRLLEVSAGSGRLAAAILRALDEGTGPRGRRVARRVRYLLTDYSDRSVREAIRAPYLRPYAQCKRVVPLLYDFRRPTELHDLHGRRVETTAHAVVATYACDVARAKVLRKTKDGFRERWDRVTFEVPDDKAALDGAPDPAGLVAELLRDPTKHELQASLGFESDWRPVDVDTALGDAVHGRIVRDLLRPFDEATVTYPYAWVDLMRDMRPLLAPAALFVVGDYGSPRRSDLRGLRDNVPQTYGNSMANGVAFPLFDAVGRALGLACLRTRDRFRSVHVAALRYDGQLPDGLRRAFRRAFVRSADGEALLDLGAVARRAFRDGDYAQAGRLYRRCLELDRRSPEAHYRFAEACLELGHARDALHHLDRALVLADGTRGLDIHFARGRALAGLERWDEALAAYETSLREEGEHHVTWLNVSSVHEKRGAFADAYRAAVRAEAMAPTDERVVERLARVRARWCDQMAGVKSGGAVDDKRGPR